MAKAKRYNKGGELPQAMVDRMAREENEADRELVAKPARAVAEGVKKMYRAATGKDPKTGEKAKDFKPRTYADQDGGHTPGTAVQTPVGGEPGPTYGSANMRSLNMGKKSKATSIKDYKKYDEERGTMVGEEFKKGGKVRGCGIAQKGLTKGRMV